MRAPQVRSTAILVDDHERTLRILRSIVSLFPFDEIREYTSAVDAFAAHKHTPAELILTDIKMPALDGLELTKKIRWECAGQAQRTPIVVVSAALDPEGVFKARDVGATALVAKPISARLLVRRISAAMHDTREFVSVSDYIGPCRRRSLDETYSGVERRSSQAVVDLSEDDQVTDDDIDAMLAQ